MGLSKVLNQIYPWSMHDFRKPILLAFAALTFLGTADAARAQTQPGTAATVAGTPSSTGPAQETQALGYWVDPATRLMWTGKDNGKDVSWKGAVKYCRKLRLAGYPDWRLATLDELQGIYDENAEAPGLARLGGPVRGTDFTWHVKGNLFLTGNQWSGTQRLDDRGKPSGYAWRFDFNEGRSFDGDEITFHTNKRALCVRGSEK